MYSECKDIYKGYRNFKSHDIECHYWRLNGAFIDIDYVYA